MFPPRKVNDPPFEFFSESGVFGAGCSECEHPENRAFISSRGCSLCAASWCRRFKSAPSHFSLITNDLRELILADKRVSTFDLHLFYRRDWPWRLGQRGTECRSRPGGQHGLTERRNGRPARSELNNTSPAPAERDCGGRFLFTGQPSFINAPPDSFSWDAPVPAKSIWLVASLVFSRRRRRSMLSPSQGRT